MLTALIVSLLICFILNIPIGFSMGISSIIAIIASGNISLLILLPQRMVASMDSFPLLAIPLFMIAGAVMEYGGVSKRIVEFSETLVGHIRGGLGSVSIIACTFFAAISGSTPATAASIGSITIPEMNKRGYPRDYSSAIVAASACLGVIIPPSTVMVLVGVTGDISVGKLLIGGLIPGLFLSMLLIIANYFYAGKLNLPTSSKVGYKEVGKSFIDAVWALIMPLIILGGIVSGIFTPTESAALAVVYGLFVGFFIYKELKIKDMITVFYKASLNSAMVMLLIGLAGVYGWVLTSCNVPTIVSNFIFSFSDSTIVIYGLILVFMLLLGCVMDTPSIIMLTIPILAPIMKSLGVDMVHFGVIVTIDLAIGMMTPPVGVSLFATCAISGVTIADISRRIWPYLIIMIFGLMVLLFIPELTTWLPNLLIK